MATEWYSAGAYCPACGKTVPGMVKPLPMWVPSRCWCGEERMPVEIAAGDAYAAHCAGNHWD